MIHYNTPSQHRRRIITLYVIHSLRHRRHMRPIITITAARCIHTKSMFLVIMALLPGLLPN
jgi:hypothetical protein